MPVRPAGTVLLSACTNDSAAAAITSYGSVPSSDTDSGIAVIPCRSRRYNRATFHFAGTDAANETFAYVLYGLLRVRSASGEALVVVPLASGSLTLGATALGANASFIESATALWADTITDTVGHPLVVAVSPAGDLMASLVVDCTDFDALLVEVTRDGQTAATMTVLGSLAQAAGILAEEP